MARVTVEDCLKNVKNRFELVIIAAKRARQLMRGKEPKVAWDNDKSTVVALREIAAGYTDFDTPEITEETLFPTQEPVTIKIEEEISFTVEIPSTASDEVEAEVEPKKPETKKPETSEEIDQENTDQAAHE